MEMLDGLKRSHYCGQVSRGDLGQKVTVMGWVQKSRDLGKLIFADLRDTEGICQISFDEGTSEEVFAKARRLGSEFVVAVQGEVRERESKNTNIPNGDIEIYVSDLRILNESETPPIYIKDNDTVSEALRLKYRYLDLRKPKMQKNFKFRHKVTQGVRNFLTSEGFVDIETPMLTKPTPEGARDYLVPSRVNPGNFYALPQSPQLFKQLLMVSGMDRYYQIVKCFRDEDLRADRQPEFTQIDCEMSFVEVEDVMGVMERLVQSVFKETMDVDIALPLPRMSYEEAMNRFGSDKPDLRYGLEIQNVTEIVRKSEFQAFSRVAPHDGIIGAINVKGEAEKFTRKNITHLEDTAKLYGAKGLAWMKFTKDGLTSPIAKFFSEELLKELSESINAEIGDLILFVADKKKVALSALGYVRIECARHLGLTDSKDFNFLYVTKFPLFEYDEEEERYVAMHHPFTSPLDEDVDKFESDPASMRAKAYDIVLNGVELGGGSIRIYNPDIQKKMFKALGFTEEEAMEKFGFLLEAFKYGVPPHGGLAFGLDRMVMLMLREESIREVIAFPKNQNAICPLTQAPAVADEKSLRELDIQILSKNSVEKE